MNVIVYVWLLLSCSVMLAANPVKVKYCPYEEHQDCPTDNTHREQDCKQPHVPRKCPYYCGVCQESERPTCEADPYCYRSAAGCIYIGKQANPQKCMTLAGGRDGPECSYLLPPDYNCTHCDGGLNQADKGRRYGAGRVLPVRVTHCPFMCGLCPSTCGDLFCKNGGVMDQSTCTCQCQSMFTGRDCSTKICPKKDSWWCSQFVGQDYCKEWPLSKYRCPYLCGVC